MKICTWYIILAAIVISPDILAQKAEPVSSANEARFSLADVFDLEYASDPQIAPSGEHIVYVRNSMDIMTDRRLSSLWSIDTDGANHHLIASQNTNPRAPRWSPNGDRLAYITSNSDGHQLSIRTTTTGQSEVIGTFVQAPSNLAWSPDGNNIAFRMFVSETPKKPFAPVPFKPKGAAWAEPVKVIDTLVYRLDGAGFVELGYSHMFVIPTQAKGAAARQVTSGAFNHDGDPAWSLTGEQLFFSANRHPDWEYDAFNSEIYALEIESGAIKALTNRVGPDHGPVAAPDGTKLAYIGFDDVHRSYEETELYIMSQDGSNKRLLSGDFGHGIENPVWQADGNGLYFQFSDKGVTKVGAISLSGEVTERVQNVGGTNLERPYASGSFSVADNGDIVATVTGTHQPADVAISRVGEKAQRLTHLNRDLFEHKSLGEIEEFWFKSSLDQQLVQGWIATPPGFDKSNKYPLILEVHGGPDANYGDRFSAQIELFNAAGYVVLFTNPRGSTSYGTEFADLTYLTYPRDEYFDLMSGVDAVIQRGYIDEENLFITGGSAGGVISSWTIGKTDRFRAAAVVNPAINWISYTLTNDRYDVFSKYFFSGFPWDNNEHYWERSPLSLVGNVSTPTMLITGEADYRTPISETDQYYQALKLLRVDAIMVRVPGANHDIAARPSNLIAKTSNIIAWFDKYRDSNVIDQS